MAIVIADTSPLQYLFQIDPIHLLPRLFGTVQVPEPVDDELRIGRTLGFEVPDPSGFPWMLVRPVTTPLPIAEVALGPGEQAALALALLAPDSLVLIDAAAARAVAKQLGLSATGTLGILLLGGQRALVTTLEPVLVGLARRGVRLARAVRQRVLELADE
jgi:uncharacterized protein